MKTRKILAMLLILSMMMGLLCIGAAAATTITINKSSRNLTDIDGDPIGMVSVANVTPSDIKISGVSDAIWVESATSSSAMIIVSLAPTTTPASGTLAVTITPTIGTAQSQNITVASGEGQGTITVGTVTYTIQIQSTEEDYVGTGCYVSEVAGEGVSMPDFTGSGTDVDPYTATASVEVTGYPFKMSLRIIPDGESYGSYSSYSYTVLDSSDTDTGLVNYVGTYFLAEFPDDAKTLRFSVTNGAGATKYYAITLHAESSSVNNYASLYAYLPAPGQFTNEGVTTGGWGDAYTSNGTPKINTSTGVSLGFYGGYAVYKFDSPVTNNVLNPFGADFIVYGNGFWKNSEPGCIQVAEGANGAPADVNGDGVIWYDIAGSQYYTGNTEYASIIYTNPNTTEDAGITSPGNNLGTRAAVSYSLNGAASASVAVNPFHNHSWWPLYANYFKTVTGRAEMAKISEFPFITSNPASPDQSSVSSTLTFTGMRLIAVNTTLSENFKFGYADVHGNYQIGGNYAYNPYEIGTASITSSSAYNTWLTDKNYIGGQASGGDPIDISWAVYPTKYDTGTNEGLSHPNTGEPVPTKKLGSIQFVRIYTGGALNNGINGELSTEVCGIATVSGTGSNKINSNLIAKVGTTKYVDAKGTQQPGSKTPNLSTISIPYSSGMTIKLTSSDTYLYVNGAPVTRTSNEYEITSVASGDVYQVITQRGTESPYIVLLKVS